MLAAQDAGPAGKDVYFPRVTEPGSSLEERKPYLMVLLEPCVSKAPATLAIAHYEPGAYTVNLATHAADFGVLPDAPLASTTPGGLTPEHLIKWAGAGELGSPGAAAQGR